MENLKANIKSLTVQLVGLEKRKKAQKPAPRHVLKMHSEVKGKLDGIFLALRLTLPENEYKALCYWQDDLEEQIEADYNKNKFNWLY